MIQTYSDVTLKSIRWFALEPTDKLKAALLRYLYKHLIFSSISDTYHECFWSVTFQLSQPSEYDAVA